MAPLQLFSAFFLIMIVSGVFSMFGKGGGSLYTPILVLLDMPIAQAISLSMLLAFLTAFCASFVFWRNKLIDMNFCRTFLPGAIVGAGMGAFLSNQMPGDVLAKIFAGFLCVAGVLMILPAQAQEVLNKRSMSKATLAIIVLISIGIGIFSSLIGIGGGLFVFPFLVLYMRFSAQQAAGTSALIVTAISLTGTIGHFSFEPVNLSLIAIASIACLMGALIGSHLTLRANPALIKAGFSLVMWGVAIQLFFQGLS